MSEDYYKVAVYCTNCDWSTYKQAYEIPKGVSWKDYLSMKQCKKCECYTLTKSLNRE